MGTQMAPNTRNDPVIIYPPFKLERAWSDFTGAGGYSHRSAPLTSSAFQMK